MLMNRLFLLFVFVLSVVMTASAQTYSSGTKIAIVPTISQTGDKWPELQKRQAEASDKWLAEQFTKRGFIVVPTADVVKAIADLKIDFGDEEQRTRTNLYKIGRQVGTTLVIFPVVTASNQGTSGGLMPRQRGTATVKLWLADAVKEEAIINAVTVHGNALGSAFLTGMEKGSALQVKAVENTLNDHLKPWFKSYPITKG
jgi:hypothetical protein